MSVTASKAGLSYSWSTGSTQTTAVVSAGGTYTVTATDAGSGCSATETIAVLNKVTTPSVSIVGATPLNCQTREVMLSAETDIENAVYKWNNEVGPSEKLLTSSGAYSVRVEDPTNGCFASVSTEIQEVLDNISPRIDGGTELSCNQSTLTLYVSGMPGGSTYKWSDNSTESTLQVTVSGEYKVTVSYGVCTGSANINISGGTDGAVMDTEGNLWVLNATTTGKPLHIRTKNGQWVGLDIYDNGQAIHLTTPGPIWIDQRNPQYKWIIDQRKEPGVILFHDNGTPTNSIDDSAIKRNIFIDQDGKTIQPANIMCLTQDLDNRIWVGTNAGLFVIPAGVDFYTSNSCKRIIIPRNDGTNLGDYLLGNEQINCMVADGGNRMWIGTANSGLYLIEDDTITVAHFTENNSLLPSNTIQSIAIMPTTGEVFVGTAKGIASYRSDASAPQEDLSQAYAFPNPARPNYGGVISIAGLMENTMVNIIDAGGNLVCKTRSHGGLAVWSGYLPDGTKAKSGIYTALCNEPNGTHTVVKILVL